MRLESFNEISEAPKKLETREVEETPKAEKEIIDKYGFGDKERELLRISEDLGKSEFVYQKLGKMYSTFEGTASLEFLNEIKERQDQIAESIKNARKIIEANDELLNTIKEKQQIYEAKEQRDKDLESEVRTKDYQNFFAKNPKLAEMPIIAEHLKTTGVKPFEKSVMGFDDIRESKSETSGVDKTPDPDLNTQIGNNIKSGEPATPTNLKPDSNPKTTTENKLPTSLTEQRGGDYKSVNFSEDSEEANQIRELIARLKNNQKLETDSTPTNPNTESNNKEIGEDDKNYSETINPKPEAKNPTQTEKRSVFSEDNNTNPYEAINFPEGSAKAEEIKNYISELRSEGINSEEASPSRNAIEFGSNSPQAEEIRNIVNNYSNVNIGRPSFPDTENPSGVSGKPINFPKDDDFISRMPKIAGKYIDGRRVS